MSRKERGSVSGQTVVLALLVGAIGVVAWLGGRRAERAALIERAVRERTEAPAPPATGEEAIPNSAPAPEDALPGEERSATLEVAVAPPAPEPTAEPAVLSARDARADDPARCLTLEASPNSASAYGATAAAVQLVIRARNSCASGFSGPATYFRAVAVSMEGTELASATGRFAGEIKPYSSAETLVAIETDPTRVRTWRVELR
jgi:hypothetical protein